MFYVMILIRDNPFSTYAKFPEKLRFLTPSPPPPPAYQEVRKSNFFEKFCVRAKWMITCFFNLPLSLSFLTQSLKIFDRALNMPLLNNQYEKTASVVLFFYKSICLSFKLDILKYYLNETMT